MYLKKLKIGNVELENNLILAPMAGITDKSFRTICKEQGVGLVCTEMASSRALFHNDSKTKKLLDIEEEKKPICVQIFGSDVESMVVASKYVEKFADIIDINMGCPAPKIVKNGDGSKLLLNLDLAEEIVKEVVKTVKCPVTVKIRKGWNEKNIVAVELAQKLEKVGAKAITIHGRTREEYFGGKCDLDIIKAVKEAVSIPVIGNGDITNEEEALKMFEYTNVDGIMCARGTLGNPFLFKQIINYLETGKKLPEITNKEKLETILKHIELEVKQKGEQRAVKEMRKHIAWYTKGMKDSSSLRQHVNQIEDKEELIQYLKENIKN